MRRDGRRAGLDRRRTSRPLYHAALAHGANHLVTLVAQALELLRPAGVAEPARLLGPLLARGARQRAARRRRGAHRPGRARRRRHGGRARARASATVSRSSPGDVPGAGQGDRRPRARAAPAPADVAEALLVALLLRGVPRDRPAHGRRLRCRHGRRPVAGRAVDRARAAHALARRAPGARSPLVPTMGALHDGHVALIRGARDELAGPVVVSDLRQPAAVRAGEDLDRYPRDLDADLAMCARGGRRRGLRPVGRRRCTRRRARSCASHAGPMGDVLEGASRPGHFDGVLTVVAKLFGPGPARRRGLRRRRTPSSSRWSGGWCATSTSRYGSRRCRPCATPDGLALSSRNRYLDARRAARRRSRCPARCGPAPRAAAGGAPADAVAAAARAVLARRAAASRSTTSCSSTR